MAAGSLLMFLFLTCSSGFSLPLSLRLVFGAQNNLLALLTEKSFATFFFLSIAQRQKIATRKKINRKKMSSCGEDSPSSETYISRSEQNLHASVKAEENRARGSLFTNIETRNDRTPFSEITKRENGQSVIFRRTGNSKIVSESPLPSHAYMPEYGL